MRTCLTLALATGILGLGLRIALPVAPADESIREVVRFYEEIAQAGRTGHGSSNTRETSVP